MTYFVLMCGEDMAAEYAGDRTGTVVAVFADGGEAEAALAQVETTGAEQRRVYTRWLELSYAENPVRRPEPTTDDFVKIGGAVIDRNKRRQEWIKAHPAPPSDMMHRFWVVALP